MQQQTSSVYNSTTSYSKISQKDIQQVFTFSQYINTIKLIKSEEDFKYLKPLTLNNFQYEKQVVKQHFIQLSIQFFYLLYSCHHKRIVPIPQNNQKYLCYNVQTNTVCLCLSEFLTFAESPLKDYDTKTPYFMFFTNFILNGILQHWKNAQKRAPPTKRMTLTADFFVKKLKQNQNKHSSQKQVFSAFQKAQIFIQTSILLRIRNSAIVCIFRKNQQLMKLFKKHRKIQYQLSQQFNERKKRKNNIQKILQTQKNIQKNIEEFFTNLKTNPRYQKVQDKDKKKRQQMGTNMPTKLLIGLKVFEMGDVSEDANNSMQPEDQNYFNVFQIQYCSTKNMIIVKMITDLIHDWATSDSILFKWNTLTFQTSNVGLQTIQKLDQNKKPRKFIAIRGTSYFNRKQPVLQKILTLIDITMATFKSIELQMKSQTFFTKNLNKIDESYSKINHYLRTIHRSCIRSYSNIMGDQHI